MSFCVKGGVYVAVADNVDDPDPDHDHEGSSLVGDLRAAAELPLPHRSADA